MPQLSLSALVVSVSDPVMGRPVEDTPGGGSASTGSASSSTTEVYYKVCLMDPDRTTIVLHRVFRTYKECKVVLKKLHAMNPDPPLPTVPKTKVFGATDHAFLTERSNALEMFFNAVCANRFLVKDMDFLRCIGYTEYTKLQANGGLHARSTSASLADCAQIGTVAAFLAYPRLTDREKDLSAARGWLRSSKFTFVRALPELSHPTIPSHKTHIQVQDTNGLSFVLSVINVGRMAPVDLKGDKLASIQRLLTTLDPRYFAPLVHLDIVEGTAFAIRQESKEGSLMDALNVSCQSVLESGSKKYKEFKPVALRHIRKWGRKVLEILSVCAAYNIPLPHLSLGNLLVSERYGIVLGDMETLLLGTTRFPPCVTPVDEDGNPNGAANLEGQERSSSSEGEPCMRTNFDILLFGLVLYQLALGKLLNASQIGLLLTAQGDPFDIPENEEGTEEEQGGHTRAGGRPHVRLTFNDVPDPIKNLLHYIFHPTNPADLRVLLHHSFFTSSEDATQPQQESPTDVGTKVKFKRKDLDLVQEVISRWREELEARAHLRRKRTEEREKVRELKRKGRTQSPSAGPNTPPGGSVSPGGAPPALPSSLLSAGTTGTASPPAASAPPPIAPPVPSAPAPSPPSTEPEPKQEAEAPPPPSSEASPPPSKAPTPPPPPSKAPPSPPPPVAPPPAGGHSALLEEIRKGTNKTYRGE